MKKLLIGLAVLLVLVVGGLAAFVKFGTEPTIRYALETEGTSATQTGVSVEDVNLSIMGGSLSLSGLKLANPDGYTTPEALSLGKVSAKVDRNSLFSDQIVVDQISLDAPSITFERGKEMSNLEKIKQAIDQYLPATPDQQEPTKTVLIRELLINGAKLNYNLKPGAKIRSLTLPDTRVENIGGTDGSGVSYQVAVEQIVDQMAPVVMRELAKAEGVDAVKGLIKDKSQLGDLLQDGDGGVKEKLEGKAKKALEGFIK